MTRAERRRIEKEAKKTLNKEKETESLIEKAITGQTGMIPDMVYDMIDLRAKQKSYEFFMYCLSLTAYVLHNMTEMEIEEIQKVIDTVKMLLMTKSDMMYIDEYVRKLGIKIEK